LTTDGALVDAMFDALNGCKTCQRLVRNPCLIAECVLASSGALELDDSSFVVQIASVAFFGLPFSIYLHIPLLIHLLGCYDPSSKGTLH